MPIYFSPLVPLSWSNKSTSEDNFIQFNRVAVGLLSLNSIRLKGAEIESIVFLWWYLVVTSLSIALLWWRLTRWFNVGRGGKSDIKKNPNLLPIKFVEINYNISSYKFFLVFRLLWNFYFIFYINKPWSSKTSDICPLFLVCHWGPGIIFDVNH